MKIREEDISPLILALLPDFQQNIDKLIRRFGDSGPHMLMDELSGYVDKGIRSGQLQELPAVFMLIERLMVEGEEKVINAVATCFLENLQNFETPSQAWVPLMGPESKDYCQAWDVFTGA